MWARKPLLGRLGEIGRQQQQPVRALALGFLGMGDCHARAVACSAEDRHTAGAQLGGIAQQRHVLLARQREKLARPAGHEERRRPIGGEPVQASCRGLNVERVVGIEIGEGERQQSPRQGELQFLRGQAGHGDRLRTEKE
jgi:hypothetical protein